jgi:hypothetical protein
MSQHVISFKYKALNGMAGAVAKKRGAALHDVPQTKRVSDDWQEFRKNLCH